MYKSISIANYLIEKSIYEGMEITPMKVLKLTYIAHGWYLGLQKKPLITEQTEAWKYGPVIPNIYHYFKHYGSNDINELYFPDLIEDKKEYNFMSENEEINSFLNEIWKVYKNFKGGELSDLTHKKGTPWDITWNKNGGSTFRGAIIPNKLIQEYYTKKASS
ncbi:MAG: SocA family protein [Ekhidna sp.]|nr:SocA family protein [Ekhidna sp.]MBC6409918.1 SocA family protein [Ekhidna sp.]